MKKLNSKKDTPELNAGSLADLAFLLLIFFLVTANIKEEYHVETNIPPINGSSDSTDRFRIEILVRNDGNISLNEHVIAISALEDNLTPYYEHGHILVLLKTQLDVNFEDYLCVFDQISRSHRLFLEGQQVQTAGFVKQDGNSSFSIRIKEVMVE